MQKFKFFNSGLYNKPFYSIYDTKTIIADNIDFRKNCNYNKNLMRTRYSECELSDLEEDQVNEIIDGDFFEDVQTHHTLYEPLIYNEEVALDCGLIPFIYNGDNKCALLALGNSGFDWSVKGNLLFKLDAYQALTYNSIDELSPLFDTYSKDIARRVLSDGVYNRVIEAINDEVI